jgi:hypothetical protein
MAIKSGGSITKSLKFLEIASRGAPMFFRFISLPPRDLQRRSYDGVLVAVICVPDDRQWSERMQNLWILIFNTLCAATWSMQKGLPPAIFSAGRCAGSLLNEVLS